MELASDVPSWSEERNNWYNQTFILLEMVKCLGRRELVFLEKQNPTIIDRRSKTIRCCNGFTIDLIKKNLEAFRILKFPYVIFYYSLMSFRQLPMFSFSPQIRTQQYHEWSDSGGYKEQFMGYDLAFDLDGETIPQAQKDAIHIIKVFDEFKLPYSVRFSGSRGFHITIEYRWLPQLPEKEIVKLLNQLGYAMKMIDNLLTLDDSIFDSRRVLKLPYSFDRGNIVLPLSDAQLQDFSLDIVKPNYVLKQIRIKDRGLLTRHTEQSEEQARASFWKLCDLFLEKEKTEALKAWR